MYSRAARLVSEQQRWGGDSSVADEREVRVGRGEVGRLSVSSSRAAGGGGGGGVTASGREERKKNRRKREKERLGGERSASSFG